MATGPIVVGTDGSPTAQQAVDAAGELARALGCAVHVISAYSVPSTGWMAAAGGMAVAELASDQHVKEVAEAAVAAAQAALGAQSVEAVTHVCAGDPADALISIAADEGAQMIVVGNRGMRGARRMLGSVPNSVSHRAKCPVLIVPTC
jgi:nucleotide-binding universal stress UspA family protein